jgi:hypothetical protein
VERGVGHGQERLAFVIPAGIEKLELSSGRAGRAFRRLLMGAIAHVGANRPKVFGEPFA